MLPHFAEARVGGVGVLPLPRNGTGWIGRMRAMETYYGVAFKRAAQSVCDAVTGVFPARPSPIGGRFCSTWADSRRA